MYYENLELNALENEEWRDIVEYEGLYQVSNLGRVKSLPRTILVENKALGCEFYKTYKPRIIKQSTDAGGYLIVSLYDGSGTRSFRNKKVHRLVEEAFIKNEDNKPQIDHKDCNRKNNVVENLRYCTSKENHHNSSTELKRSKVVAQIDSNGNVLGKFRSAKDAAKKLNMWYKPILECCMNIRESHNGYKWAYID